MKEQKNWIKVSEREDEIVEKVYFSDRLYYERKNKIIYVILPYK